MNLERMQHDILQIFLASKRKDGQGLLTAETIMERLGEGVDDDDVQLCLRGLGEDGLIDPLPGDDRILAAVLTTRGEILARGH